MARVRFSGILLGQGHEENCEGWVTEESLSNGEFAYTEYRITQPESSRVPPGSYRLLTHAQVIEVRPGPYGWIQGPAL
jgi:hypothetical protein